MTAHILDLFIMIFIIMVLILSLIIILNQTGLIASDEKSKKLCTYGLGGTGIVLIIICFSLSITKLVNYNDEKDIENKIKKLNEPDELVVKVEEINNFIKNVIPTPQARPPVPQMPVFPNRR